MNTRVMASEMILVPDGCPVGSVDGCTDGCMVGIITGCVLYYIQIQMGVRKWEGYETV